MIMMCHKHGFTLGSLASPDLRLHGEMHASFFQYVLFNSELKLVLLNCFVSEQFAIMQKFDIHGEREASDSPSWTKLLKPVCLKCAEEKKINLVFRKN